MVKHSVLTPVLAAVLGVTVVGSGVGYYFTRNSTDNNDKAKSDTSIKNVADNINNTLDTAKKAVNGELDFAYDASVKVSFGQGFTDTVGMEISPITATTSTKQKGQNTAVDVALAYNDQTLCSLNAVYARDSKDVYAKIPELSDAYIKYNVDSVKDMMGTELSTMGVDLDSLTAEATDTTQFDTEAFEKSLDGYAEAFKGALPEAKDGGNVTGTIDDIEYEYTTKTYTITGADASKAVSAVLEKAKTDETLKAYFDETLKSVYETQLGTTDDSITYESMIQQIIDQFNSEDISSDTESIDFDLYYNSADEFVGFDVKAPDGEVGEYKLITANNDTVAAVDMMLYVSDTEKMTIYGSAKTENDATNGSFALNFTASDSAVEGTLKLTDLKENGDAFSGTIRTDVNVTSSDTAVSGWVELKSNSSDDALDLSYEIGMNGQAFVTVAVKGNKTEASDITIPTDGTIYDGTDETQMNEYLSSCNTTAFTDNIKAVLGDELYNMFTSSASSVGGSDTDYDYDYGDTDYDEYLTDYSTDDIDYNALMEQYGEV